MFAKNKSVTEKAVREKSIVPPNTTVGFLSSIFSTLGWSQPLDSFPCWLVGLAISSGQVYSGVKDAMCAEDPERHFTDVIDHPEHNVNGPSFETKGHMCIKLSVIQVQSG